MSYTSETKRLYKSRTERMIDGVCGGVAKYFSLDPTLVRIAWVMLTLLGGSGIVLYIVAMIIMPKEPFVFPAAGPTSPDATPGTPSPGIPGDSSKKNSLFWGILLIGAGMILFLHNMGFSFWHHWWWFDWDFALSLLLILTGVAFLWGGRNSLVNSPVSEENRSGDTAANEPTTSPLPHRLYRSISDSKLFGVCGGLAEYFGIDPTIVRILFVIGIFVSGGAVLIGYIIMAIVVPKEVPTFKPV